MGNRNEVIKCMYEGELFAYLPKWAIEDEYDLPDDKLSEVMSSNKGDVVRALGDTFENIGSIDDLLKENADIHESRLRIWRKLTQRNCELKEQKQINSELSKQNGELLLEIEALKAEIADLKEKRETLASVVRCALICAEGLHVDDDCNIVDENGEIID